MLQWRFWLLAHLITNLYVLRSIVAIIPGGGLEFLDMRLLGILIQIARRWSKTEAGATEEHLPKPKCFCPWKADNIQCSGGF
jgi:hypothetical protein